MDNHQKTSVWQWILLAALVVIFAVMAGKAYLDNGIVIVPGAPDAKIERTKTEEEKEQAIFENDKNILIQASSSGDQSLCAKISNATLKQSCMDDTQIRQAVNALDPALCESVSTEDLKTYCLEKVERWKSPGATTSAE